MSKSVEAVGNYKCVQVGERMHSECRLQWIHEDRAIYPKMTARKGPDKGGGTLQFFLFVMGCLQVPALSSIKGM